MLDFGYFKREEFACKCGCGFATVDIELLSVLNDVREHFSAVTTINSACRCINHNHEVGGSPKSSHRKGIAADIVVSNVEPSKVADYLENKYGGYGIGRYDTFTHIDVRNTKGRWNG